MISREGEYPLVRFHRDAWNRMVLDLGRGERPYRITLWPSRRRSWWGVERRPAVHQVRVHFGRLHVTAGRFVWRRA